MSNLISLIRGTSGSYAYNLVTDDGEYIPSAQLAGATAQFDLKVTPTDPASILQFTTADPAHLTIDVVGSTLQLKLAPADTQALALQLYVYQIAVTLADGTRFMVVPWAQLDLNLGGVASTPQPPFDNTAKLDHNWDMPDRLQYVTPGGTPIPDAQIRVYYKSEYEAGNVSNPIGITMTDAFGRWKNPILVKTGYTYKIHFFKPNEFGPDLIDVVI